MPVLRPEHLADLRRSGLTDETIAAAGCHSVAPEHVRHLLDVEVTSSGMAIPYPGCMWSDGRPYLRVRLDRPFTGRNGNSVRYLTRRGERNRIYAPAMLPQGWAANPTVPLVVTEGEKKCLRSCQESIPCVAFAGVWSWRTTIGPRTFPLPDLCNIHWWGRQVFIAFDSDVATNRQVQAAEKALAQELISRGAQVRLVRLPPGPNNEKVGLDDFLLDHTREDFVRLPVTEVAKSKRAGDTVEYIEFTREPGPIAWVLEPILPQGTISFVSSDAGAGKTWLAIDMSQAVASGHPWLGQFPVTQGPVLYYDEESSLALMHQRIWQLRLCEPELPPDLPIRFRFDSGLLIDQPEGIDLLRADLEELAPALVILDSFRACFSGDENSSAEVRVAMRSLRRTANEFGCAIVMLHHVRKLSQSSNASSQMVRGSTDLRGAVDSHLFLRVREPGSLLVEHEKSRWAPPVETFGVQLLAEEEGGLSICYVPDVNPEGDKLDEARLAILGGLGEVTGPMDRPTLLARAKAQGITRRTGERALRELEDSKQIVRAGKRGHRTLYQRTGNADLALL